MGIMNEKMYIERNAKLAELQNQYREEITPYIEMISAIEALSIPAYIVTDDTVQVVKQPTDAQREIIQACDDAIEVLRQRFARRIDELLS